MGVTFINPFMVSPAGGGTVGFSFVTSADDTTTINTNKTFSSVSLGAAAADREIVVAISLSGVNTNFIGSVTIGGVSATRDVGYTTNQAAVADIGRAAVPTGTTGNIVITLNTHNGVQTFNRWSIGVYRLTGRAVANAAPFDTAGPSAGNGGITVNLDVEAGGVIIAAGRNAGTATWSGLTEDYNAFDARRSASATFVSGETNHAVTLDSDASNDARVSAASYH